MNKIISVKTPKIDDTSPKIKTWMELIKKGIDNLKISIVIIYKIKWKERI